MLFPFITTFLCIRGNETQCQRRGEEAQLFTRNKGRAIIIIILCIIQQCNGNGFVRQHPMWIRCAGSNSLARGNYLQEVIGNLVMCELVVLLVSGAFEKKVSIEGISVIVLCMNYSLLQDRRICAACYLQITFYGKVYVKWKERKNKKVEQLEIR